MQAMSDSLLGQLRLGVEAMGLTASGFPLQNYVSFVELLAQWNKAYNLTAIRDPEKMLAYHVLDSLSILPFVHGNDCMGIIRKYGLYSRQSSH